MQLIEVIKIGGHYADGSGMLMFAAPRVPDD